LNFFRNRLDFYFLAVHQALPQRRTAVKAGRRWGVARPGCFSLDIGGEFIYQIRILSTGA
jgi:hypothetical protein